MHLSAVKGRNQMAPFFLTLFIYFQIQEAKSDLSLKQGEEEKRMKK